MSAEVLALATAFLRGFSTIPTRRGLQQSTARSSALIYLLVNTTLLWSLTVILYPLDHLTTQGLEYFVLAGVFAPGVARTVRDVSIMRLGVAMTSPIVATNTLFAVLFAVVFLHEPVTLPLLIGTTLVVGGVIVLSYRRGPRAWQWSSLLYPILAALLFAASTNIRKMGLQASGFPLLGAAVTSSISLLLLASTLLLSRRRQEPLLALSRETAKLFVVSSITSSLAFLFYFLALSQGFLVRVQPIAATNPLFALLFSHFLLKDLETITPRLVLGAALIFSGILFILL